MFKKTINIFLIFLFFVGKIICDTQNYSILLLYVVNEIREKGAGIYGTSVHRINFYKKLKESGFNVSMLIDNKKLEKLFDSEKLEYYTCRIPGEIEDSDRLSFLTKEICKVCTSHNISIIHCNGQEEIKAAKLVASQIPVKVVATVHSDKRCNLSLLNCLDGVIGVNPKIPALIKKNDINIPIVTYMPPFFDEEKFLKFSPKYTKQDFFKKLTGKSLENTDIICMIANFYPNKTWKNHALLLKATKQLIYKHKSKIAVICAGDGATLNDTKQLAKRLGISNYIYFVGYVKDIPELLYHSDIKVLTSNEESFGIVLLEAALMKKPMIGVKGTGMENIIEHNKTGLLINKNNMNELVGCIKYLLDNRDIAQKFGENAYNFVTQKYLSNSNIKKLIDFYLNVIKPPEFQGVL
jgi:glycosyltransferase involved in cell wall biosynthesis